jgi:fructose-1,6-bisphosphatase-3
MRLRKHIAFLYDKGGMYRRFNGNLLFHGCIPMEEDGSFHVMKIGGQDVQGRALMDAADRMARRAFFKHDRDAQDFMWYLWCGEFSPLCGRKTTTFAHIYLRDIPEVLHEPRLWPEYHPGYFGAFVRDPDGNNVEAVFHGATV